jgi:hypothetical protein
METISEKARVVMPAAVSVRRLSVRWARSVVFMRFGASR